MISILIYQNMFMVFQGTYENTIPKQNIKKNLNKTNELQKVI